jgi:hypothetical protein
VPSNTMWIQTQKNSKEPSSKREPRVLELKWTSLYSTNMTWKQRSTIVNFYHKYFATYVNKQLKEPFPTFMAYTLNMDVIIYDVYSTFTPDITNMWILSKMIEDTVVKMQDTERQPEFRRHTIGYRFVEEEKIENYSEF